MFSHSNDLAIRCVSHPRGDSSVQGRGGRVESRNRYIVVNPIDVAPLDGDGVASADPGEASWDMPMTIDSSALALVTLLTKEMVVSSSKTYNDKTFPAEKAVLVGELSSKIHKGKSSHEERVSKKFEKHYVCPRQKIPSLTLQISNQNSKNTFFEMLAGAHLMLVEKVSKAINHSQSLQENSDQDMSNSCDEDDELSENDELNDLTTLD